MGEVHFTPHVVVMAWRHKLPGTQRHPIREINLKDKPNVAKKEKADLCYSKLLPLVWLWERDPPPN